MEEYDYMEVDIPNLISLKPELHGKNDHTIAFPPNGDNHRSRGHSICLVKPEPHHEQVIMLPQYSQYPSRRQQTNQPTRMDVEMSPTGDQLDGGSPCPPSTDDFDNIEPSLPSLSDSEKKCIEQIMSVLGHEVPHVPEIGGPSQTIHLILHDHIPLSRQTDIITLVSDQERSLMSPGSACGSMELLSLDQTPDGELLHKIMEEIPEETLAPDHAKDPPCRLYDLTARRILDLHSTVGLKIQMLHAKKKPMLHEFIGYILFLCNAKDHTPGLEVLHKAIYFCHENGDRVEPQKPSSLFKVREFEAVSQVWRRVKSNASTDTIKNMKRAMRMSTTNDRNYFVNLSHRMHRRQIFSFGERSMEFFRLAFPEHFPSCKGKNFSL